MTAKSDATDPTVRRWLTEIELFERERQDYFKRCEDIVKRYRDERPINGATEDRLNILWSNIETLKPAVYAQTPKAEVKRRFNDRDPVGRVASQILERAVSYFLDCKDDYNDALQQSRDDYLLVGIGQSWIRYVPHMREGVERVQVTDDGEGGYVDKDGSRYGEASDGEDGKKYAQRPATPEVAYEEVAVDFVHYRDFGHTAGARTWAEVSCVWRRVYMGRKKLIERFGKKIGSKVTLDVKPKGIKKTSAQYEQFKKAEVYEIWDRNNRKACWVSPGYKHGALDERADPLKLENFFPCPKPLFGSLTTDSLIPVPDFAQYQDQAREIDKLTGRIGLLTKALKLRGLYAADIDEIKRLVMDGNEAELLPVANWEALANIGGLEKALAFMPLKDIANALITAYEARERAKQDLYEVTGLSDIIRGSTDAQETATAQQIKAQWGSVRVREKQKELARFARDEIRIIAEIIAEHFDPKTIALIANVESLKDDPEVIQQALHLIQNDPIRAFRVQIESDSTIAPDEQADKESRVEFLTALTQFVVAWAPVLQATPQMAPLAAEALKFAVRGFKAGEELEGIIEQVLDNLTGESGVDPEKAELQQALQEAQAQIQAAEQDRSIEQGKLGVERYKAETDRWQALGGGNASPGEGAPEGDAQPRPGLDLAGPSIPGMDEVMAMAMQLSAPKQVVRDEGGQVVGVQPIEAQEPPPPAGNIMQSMELLKQALAAAAGPKKIMRDQAGEIVAVVPEGMGTA